MSQKPPNEILRGHLELILLSILEPRAMYGFEIAKEASSRTEGYFDFKEGSLYPALHRLEQAGWLRPELRELGRNGKPRKYYLLTEEGHKSLQHKRLEWVRLAGAIRSVGGEL